MFEAKSNLRDLLIKFVYSVFFLGVIMPLFFGVPITAYAISPEWTGNTAASFAGGTGTEQDPYLISTGEQLAYFSQQVNGGNNYSNKYIRLTQDILLNRMNADGTFVSAENKRKKFTAIGSPAKPFRGTFEGNDYKIIGLYIDLSYVDYQGLFGYADTGSVIKNVKVSGSIAGGNRTGSVAGYTNGLITGCVISSAVTINYRNYHGGVVGYAGTGSVISNCTVLGSVSGSECVGGVVGRTEGRVIDCSDNNSVTGYKQVGGIVGYAVSVNSVVSNCTFSGTVTGTGSYYLGGIVGQTEGLITGCSTDAALSGNNSYIGGIAGYAAGVGSKIVDCTILGTVATSGGAAYAGGVAGRTDGEIKGCTVNVTVTAPNSYIGGVVGYSYGTGSIISDCRVSGTIRALAGEGYVGGVAGKTDGKITGCICDCTVTGVHHYVGGVVGYANTGSEVSNSSSSGNVSGNSEVGGIAGYTNGVIKICINTGDVTGNNGHSGGIAGMTGDNSTLSNSFNSGAVDGGSGQGGIGGIVGYVSPSTIVHHNLNKGTVEGNQLVGCVIGNSISEENAWYNYYYDYENAPEGTTNGDIDDDDGAVPVGNLTWEEICALLNNNNDDGDDIWDQDLDDDGVPKPSPGSASEVINSAIKAGRYYTASTVGAGTSVSVTSESIFTVTFSMRYKISCEPEEQTLGLKNGNAVIQLPADTSIIMLEGNSYYYINLTVPKDSIGLSEFIKMGTVSQYYNAAPVLEGEEKTYLFIIDFSKTPKESQIAAGTYHIELLTDSERYGGDTPPVVTVTGKNNYTLTANGAANIFMVNFAQNSVPGYDFKTDGKMFAYEFYLEKNGIRVPFPIGTVINGTVVASELPYTFAAAPLADLSFSLDMSGCAVPLTPGNYNLHIKAHACTDILNPRNGYVLAYSTTNVSLNTPADYAIKVNGGTIVYNRSESDIPVDLTVRTLGAGNVKATLQRKYGTGYVNIEGQENKPVTITGEKTNVYVPANSPKGTYRFVLSIYDENGTQKAKDVQNIIIK